MSVARLYVASKAKYAPMWRDLRASGWPIISTWIDEADEGATTDWGALWERCIAEAATADALLGYHQHRDVWKGAYVEIGAALAHEVPVHIWGAPLGSWMRHPGVRAHATAGSVARAIGLPYTNAQKVFP
jgi:hypothetical protein